MKNIEARSASLAVENGFRLAEHKEVRKLGVSFRSAHRIHSLWLEQDLIDNGCISLRIASLRANQCGSRRLIIFWGKRQDSNTVVQASDSCTCTALEATLGWVIVDCVKMSI